MKNSEKILQNIIRKLRMFGFVNVNAGNITRDEVYSFYLKKILIEKLGLDPSDDAAVKEFLRGLSEKE